MFGASGFGTNVLPGIFPPVTTSGGPQSYTLDLSDDTSNSDSVSTSPAFKELVDNLSSSEVFSRVSAFARSLSNSTSITESLTRVKGYARSFVNNTSISDVVTTPQAYIQSVNDTLKSIYEVLYSNRFADNTSTLLFDNNSKFRRVSIVADTYDTLGSSEIILQNSPETNFSLIFEPASKDISQVDLSLAVNSPSHDYTFSFDVFAVDVDDRSVFTSPPSTDLAPLTTAKGTYSVTNKSYTDKERITVDITSVIDEVVSRPGFVLGNEVCIYLTNVSIDRPSAPAHFSDIIPLYLGLDNTYIEVIQEYRAAGYIHILQLKSVSHIVDTLQAYKDLYFNNVAQASDSFLRLVKKAKLNSTSIVDSIKNHIEVTFGNVLNMSEAFDAGSDYFVSVEDLSAHHDDKFITDDTGTILFSVGDTTALTDTYGLIKSLQDSFSDNTLLEDSFNRFVSDYTQDLSNISGVINRFISSLKVLEVNVSVSENVDTERIQGEIFVRVLNASETLNYYRTKTFQNIASITGFLTRILNGTQLLWNKIAKPITNWIKKRT